MVGGAAVAGHPWDQCRVSSCAWSPGLSLGVSCDPSFDGAPPPHPPGRENHLGHGEVIELPCDLIGALPRHSQQRGDLRHTHEVMAHPGIISKTLDRRYLSLILLR